MGDLDHCHGPIRSSYIGRFIIGPVAWGTVIKSLSCPLFGDVVMTFHEALFDTGIKGCSPTCPSSRTAANTDPENELGLAEVVLQHP